MTATTIHFTAIRAKLASLKAAYPRKRGTRAFIHVSYLGTHGRTSGGYADWDGATRESLLRAKRRLLGHGIAARDVQITLHLTHPAIAASDPVAAAAKANITADLLAAIPKEEVA